MQSLAVFVLMCAALVMSYEEKYDNLDADAILADEERFNAYIACLLDKGECTILHAQEFRELLPEIVATACAKCTDTQKKNLKKSVKALHERKPAEFEEFKTKYDPEGEHQQKFAKFVLSDD